jgi:hypothetical protein
MMLRLLPLSMRTLVSLVGVADDGVDNERVLSWARHAVGVVALVEGDGLVGPI